MSDEIDGLWPLRGSEPPLWTAKAADIIRNKETGKEYIRGKMKLFKVSELPKKIEDEPEKWEFIYLHNKGLDIGAGEYLRDIWTAQMLKK